MDTPLAVFDAANNATYYYHCDANKNVTELTDASGDVVAHYEYGPFGETITSTGVYAATNPFRFSSEFFDNETGLVYYNYRYYSPGLGRWLSRDPIQEQGGWNLYNMCGNNPVNYWDNQGQFWAAIGAVAGAVAGTAIGFASGYKSGGWWGGVKGAIASAAGMAVTGALTAMGQPMLGGALGGAVSGYLGGLFSGHSATESAWYAGAGAGAGLTGAYLGSLIGSTGYSEAPYGKNYEKIGGLIGGFFGDGVAAGANVFIDAGIDAYKRWIPSSIFNRNKKFDEAADPLSSNNIPCPNDQTPDRPDHDDLNNRYDESGMDKNSYGSMWEHMLA